MANFLTNLVNRLNQHAEVVRARPVSMFEPQTRLDLSPWVAGGQPTVETGEAVEQQGDRQARGPNPNLSEQLTAPEQPRQPQASIGPHTSLTSVKTKTKPESSAASDPQARLGYLVYQPAFQWYQPPREPHQYPEINPVPQGDVSLEPERVANPEVKIHPREGHATARREGHPLKTSAMASIRPNLLEPDKSRKAGQITPQIFTQKDLSPAEPAINVTIGCVEVIAVPPSVPAKAPKPSRPSPVISLDEYLKSREQERQT